MSDLQDYEIPSPCDASWEEMAEADRGRFCQRCQHHVVDVSQLTEPQWQALLDRSEEESICVRLITVNDQPQLRRPDEQLQRQRRGLQKMVHVAAAVSLVGLAACDKEQTTKASAQPAVTKPTVEPAASKTPPITHRTVIQNTPKPTRPTTPKNIRSEDDYVSIRKVTLKQVLRDLEVIQVGRIKRKPRPKKAKPSTVVITNHPPKTDK